jgi:hypothetical protein
MSNTQHPDKNAQLEAAFLRWRRMHTIENRTLKEAWMAGYLSALQDAEAFAEWMGKQQN